MKTVISVALAVVLVALPLSAQIAQGPHIHVSQRPDIHFGSSVLLVLSPQTHLSGEELEKLELGLQKACPQVGISEEASVANYILDVQTDFTLFTHAKGLVYEAVSLQKLCQYITTHPVPAPGS